MGGLFSVQSIKVQFDFTAVVDNRIHARVSPDEPIQSSIPRQDSLRVIKSLSNTYRKAL